MALLFGLRISGVTIAAMIQNYRLRIQRRILSLEMDSALNLQRASLARDMHDDIGASLSQIVIQSDVVKRSCQPSPPPRKSLTVLHRAPDP